MPGTGRVRECGIIEFDLSSQAETSMARIPLIDESDPGIDPALRVALRNAGESRGWVINVFKALANRPAALKTVSMMLQTVYRKDSTLDPRHGELAYLSATTANNCHY